MATVRDGGLAGYFAKCGVWRPLGQYLPTALFLRNPDLFPVLVLLTHTANTLLFFAVSRRLFGGLKLPLFAALIFGVFPFGYEAQTWMITYDYLLPVTFFLSNILLLTGLESTQLTTRSLFFASGVLSFCAALANECLFFATIASGLFAWTRLYPLSFTATLRGRAVLGYAPFVGCGIWLGLYYLFKPSVMPKEPLFNAASIISVYLHQYSLLYVFEPWFNSATRALLFFRWNGLTVALIAALAGFFFVNLSRLAYVPPQRREFATDLRRLFMVISCLVVGGSIIYAIGGGYSLDSRKKYPLLVLMLWFACWCWRSARKERSLALRPFVAAVSIAVVIGAPSAWLVTGVWKHEASRYNELADFIVGQHIKGPISVSWDPDIYKAWPHYATTLGFRMDNEWVVNLAIGYRGGDAVQVVSPGGASPRGCTGLKYDSALANWRVVPTPAKAADL